MTYQQAMSFALAQINERIEEVGAVARQAKEEMENPLARPWPETIARCRNLSMWRAIPPKPPRRSLRQWLYDIFLA
jgi:hypothetical protein